MYVTANDIAASKYIYKNKHFIKRRKKTGIKGATVTGNVEVNGWQLLLKTGAIIEGDLEFKNGGTLEIYNSTIRGNLEFKKSTNITLVNADIEGDVDVKSSGDLRIDGGSSAGDFDIKKSKNVTVDGGSSAGDFDVKKNLNVESLSKLGKIKRRLKTNFGYFVVLPFTFNTLLTFGVGGIDAYMNMKDYLILSSKILVFLGFIFQLPNCLLVMGFMGIINSKKLMSYQRYVIVAFAIISAMLTPPDPITMMALWIPLVLLYELGYVLVFLFVDPFQKKSEEDSEVKDIQTEDLSSED